MVEGVRNQQRILIEQLMENLCMIGRNLIVFEDAIDNTLNNAGDCGRRREVYEVFL